MEDETEKISKDESIYKPEIVECGTCGYHYQKTKKCPQCSMKEGL
jgi:Zn ribbon nucleic-acid-binding protein